MKKMPGVPTLVCSLLLLGESLLTAADTKVSVVQLPPTSTSNPHYTSNRAPLVPAPFLKLPIGSIEPRGWLRHQLRLETKGMTGRLTEISKWCKFEGNAWADPQGQGHSGWEELPYWLKGFGDLGYVLKDEKVTAEARKWIDAVLGSQEEDGWFGPRSLKTSLGGKPDLWPHMVMCNALQSFHEATGDLRVVPFLTRYFKWLNQRPADNFGAGYWPKIRFGDNIETVHWVYNRTGEPWLLDLAKKIHDNMARWDKGVIDWHNVNIAQGFRAPAVFYVQGGERGLLDAAERNYREVMGIYGQFPGGGFGGDEVCRPGFIDPRQGFETCGFIEFMHSFEMLTKISGNPVWSDRCEEIAFNSLPATMTADQKALHYLTSANQVQLDKGNKAPGIFNRGTMFSYTPFEAYRCCQHNVSHGWPYFAEELWLATPDKGLCASLYSASEVSAKIGSGQTATITEETDYPFDDRIRFTVKLSDSDRFPLYLRVPGWCKDPAVRVNGKALRVPKEAAPSYIVLDRKWKTGDKVELRLPMTVSVRTWEKNKNAVSVDYGPLTFSLKIGERWAQYGSNAKWPEFEVFPATPWNYGLVLNSKNPEKSFTLVKADCIPENPFTVETAPIRLEARAKKIPAWKQDENGLINTLQESPVRSDEPEETIQLLPMGAARLRLTSFPVIGEPGMGHEWTTPPASKPSDLSASHCFEGDTVRALADKMIPKSSNDQTIPRFTWWDHRGTSEWVQRSFEKPVRVSSVEVYWFDDTGAGSCRVPASWELLYLDGDAWKPVQEPSEFGVRLDRFNRAQFKEVETKALRIVAKLQPDFSAGILEWQVSPK